MNTGFVAYTKNAIDQCSSFAAELYLLSLVSAVLTGRNMQFFDFGTFGELIPIEGNLDEKGNILYGLFETSEDVKNCNPAVITKAHMLTAEQKEAARKHKSELSDKLDRGMFNFL